MSSQVENTQVQNAQSHGGQVQTGHLGRLENEYSDHTLLRLEHPDLKINQLNVAQLGRIEIFPNNRFPEGFYWSCKLRTPSILRQLAHYRAELVELGYILLAIANNSELNLEEKNKQIQEVSSTVITDKLRAMGFAVKDMTMWPNKLFNPNASSNAMMGNPHLFIKGPSYVLEDTKSFTSRLQGSFKAMFESEPDLVTCQEIEFGQSDGINFTEVHNSLLPANYTCLKPRCNNATTLVSTYYKTETFEDISTLYPAEIKLLTAGMGSFGDSDVKVHVTCLRRRVTDKIFFVANIHADYGKANKLEPWITLQSLFNEYTNLIVSGDFNLTIANKAYFEDTFKDFSGKYVLLQTPEPEDIGNPTYDLILHN